MSVTLTKIGTADARYPLVEGLLASAFPEDERRDSAQQRLFADTRAPFVCSVIEADDRVVGLLNYWLFDQICYIEHLAIMEDLRGMGYGAEALKVLSAMTDLPIVLEAELPTDDISRRRIDFYRRQGYSVIDGINYVQPPYRQGGNEVPMLLMAHGPVEALDYHNIINTLRQNVYCIA